MVANSGWQVKFTMIWYSGGKWLPDYLLKIVIFNSWNYRRVFNNSPLQTADSPESEASQCALWIPPLGVIFVRGYTRPPWKVRRFSKMGEPPHHPFFWYWNPWCWGSPIFRTQHILYIYTICVCMFEKCFKEGKATEMVPLDAIICQKNSRTGSLGHSWYGLIRGASHVPHLGRSDVSPFWWKLTLSGVLHLQKIESFHCQFSCWRVPNIYIYIYIPHPCISFAHQGSLGDWR